MIWKAAMWRFYLATLGFAAVTGLMISDELNQPETIIVPERRTVTFEQP